MEGKRTVKNLKALIALFGDLKKHDWEKPLRITWEIFVQRELSQNALSHVWYKQIAEHFPDRFPKPNSNKGCEDEVKRFCKLNFGVKALAKQDPKFATWWLEKVRNVYSYEDRLAMMDFIAVTSQFKTETMTEYLNVLQAFFDEQGLTLESTGEYERIMLERYDV